MRVRPGTSPMLPASYGSPLAVLPVTPERGSSLVSSPQTALAAAAAMLLMDSISYECGYPRREVNSFRVCSANCMHESRIALLILKHAKAKSLGWSDGNLGWYIYTYGEMDSTAPVQARDNKAKPVSDVFVVVTELYLIA